MNDLGKRAVYVLVGATCTPLFLGLAFFLIRHPTQYWSAPVTYSSSILFCAIGILAMSAFRAAFRSPPWWIVSPEKSREAHKQLVRRQLLDLAKSEVKLSKKTVKNAEQSLKLLKKLQELESAEPGASPNGGQAEPLANSGVTGGPPSVS